MQQFDIYSLFLDNWPEAVRAAAAVLISPLGLFLLILMAMRLTFGPLGLGVGSLLSDRPQRRHRRRRSDW